MARPTDYPRWRYHAMQASMWLLLACSVGVAALVDWDIRRNGANALSQPVQLDSIAIKVPKGWQVSELESSGQYTSIAAIEPVRSITARRITIVERDPRKANLLEKMFGPDFEVSRLRGARDRIRFGENAAGYLSISRTPLPADMEVDAELHITATGNLGNGLTLNITLDALEIGGRPSVEQSVDLVKRIAASARLVPPDPGPTIGPG